jgi:hypothetical protein
MPRIQIGSTRKSIVVDNKCPFDREGPAVTPLAEAALRQSITERWEPCARGEEGGGCALCNEFARACGCDGCPVKAATGLDGCRGSPYWDYMDALGRYDDYAHPAVMAAAQAELDFLVALLPGDEHAK